MKESILAGRLNFLREAERLKNVLRSGFTSSGRPESTAEHSWRLALMALVFADELHGLDLAHVLKLCVVHDLGEAIHGDIPAIHQHAHPGKSAQERADLHTLTRDLDPPLRAEIIALWDEYEAAATPEAQAVKAFDKLETILQHWDTAASTQALHPCSPPCATCSTQRPGSAARLHPRNECRHRKAPLASGTE